MTGWTQDSGFDRIFERLREALSSIRTPTLILGGMDDPISTPELMTRTARCLPHCKLIIYSNCGHNIDTDLTEELTEEADRFLTQVAKNGKWYTFQTEGSGVL